MMDIEERVKELSTQVADIGKTMTEMRITLGRIEERTSGQKETRSEVGSVNKQWISTMVGIAAVLIALVALLLKKP